MAKAEMTGRERIQATIRHEEPDRVPISPRVQAWLNAECGDTSLTTQLDKLLDKLPFVPGLPKTFTARFYKFTPAKVRFIDNEKSFAHHEEFIVEE